MRTLKDGRCKLTLSAILVGMAVKSGLTCCLFRDVASEVFNAFMSGRNPEDNFIPEGKPLPRETGTSSHEFSGNERLAWERSPEQEACQDRDYPK